MDMHIKEDPEAPVRPQGPPKRWRGRAISINSTPSPTPSDHHISQFPHQYQDIGMDLMDTSDHNGTTSDLPTRSVNPTYEETPTDDAMHSIGADSRQLINCIQKLETLGIKATLPSLPKFVVVGDQSAGKSSIIEATCDLKLPRSEGTCTRCPFKITTTSSSVSSWSCKISVHQKYRYDLNVQAGPISKYDYWVETEDVYVTNIATIHDRNDIELALRRAQVIILNPSRSPGDFIDIDMRPYLASEDMERDGLIDVEFSPNWVALDIAGPGLPELSLFDLPGAINVHRDGDKQHLVGFIETLITSYMEEEKTLILLACPMGSDVDTSTAFRYIIQSKASNRSMGVRTKADLAERTVKYLRHELPLLEGKVHRLDGGWFITKACSQEDIDNGTITHAEARENERKFFADDIWQEVLGQKYGGRLGIPSLQTALSDRLTTHIRRDLPTIMARIHDRLLRVKKELQRFPKADENPAVTVMKELDLFKTTIADQVGSRTGSSGPFVSEFRKLFKKLSAVLDMSKPKFGLTTPGFVPRPQEIQSDEEVDDSPTTKRKRGAGNHATPKRPAPAHIPQAMRPHMPKEARPQLQSRLTLTLKQLQDKLDAAPEGNLPDNVSDTVILNLIRESTVGWDNAVTRQLLPGVQKLFANLIKLGMEAINPRRGTEFFNSVERCSAQHCQQMLQESEQRVQDIIESERTLPFTISKEFRKEHATLKVQYHLERNIERVKEYVDSPPEGAKTLTNPDVNKLASNKEWIESVLEADEYEREITAIARTMAYYNVAYQQLVDSLFKNIYHHHVHPFVTQLYGKLLVDLKATDSAHCEQLLVVDAGLQRQRHQLMIEEGKLYTALEELTRLGSED